MRSDATSTPVRHYAPSASRRTEVHRTLEARAGLSEAAAMLLVELDLFGEVRITTDEHLPAVLELEARGLAERSETPRACVHVVPSAFVRGVMESVRSILALEAELARREASRAAAALSPATSRYPSAASPSPAPPSPAASSPGASPTGPLSAELERAIVEDALAVIERSPVLPSPSKVRVYLRTGPRFVRVFWTYASIDDGSGSILHFVERATGRVYRAKSGRQVGAPTARVIAGFTETRDA